MTSRIRRTVGSRVMRVPVFFPTKAFTPSEHPQTGGCQLSGSVLTVTRDDDHGVLCRR